jgi:hypothetical protein
MYRLALIFFSTMFLFASPASAKPGPQHSWVVSQLSGDARVVHGGLQPASLKVNAILTPGDLILTGPTGRATLSNDADYIVIAPRSELRLPTAQQPKGFTRVIQNLGTMLFRVQHTGVPHFAVDTPMLAAVVKGTTFTIIVDRNRSAVQVTEGVVEVNANDGGMKQLVEGGKTVFINRSDPKTIIDADSQPAKASTTTSAAVKVSGSRPVSLASITSLTGGLVRAEATPQSPSSQPSTVAAVAPAPVTAPVSNASAPGSIPGTTDPVLDIVQTTVPAVTEPVVDIVQTTVPAVTEPVVDIIQTTVPAVTQPVVDVIQTGVPAVLEPVVDIVQTTVPAVTQPVVDIVQTTLPAVTQPVVDIVQTTVPAVTQPVVDIVQTTVPAVTQPVVDIVQTTVPAVTQPVVNIVTTVLGGLLHP